MGTALHYAAERGFTPVVRTLLEGGASVDILDSSKRPPIILAVHADRRQIVALLVEHGSKVTGPVAAYLGDVEATKRLLAAGLDLDAGDEAGRTVLHIAVEQEQRDVSELLIAGDADVNAKDRYGRTPLFLAAGGRLAELARMLINADAEVNATDHVGCVPLHVAADRGTLDAVKLLINSGANLDAKTTQGLYDGGDLPPGYYAQTGWTPLQAAADRDREDVMQLLIRSGATASPRQAVQAGALDIVQSLVAKGVDVNAPLARPNETLLHRAVRSGHTDITGFLLEKGADPEARSWGNHRALHHAARAGHRDIVDLLLNHGALIDATNDHGCSALHVACYYGYRAVAECLLDHGAAINNGSAPQGGWGWPYQISGWRPLHYAAALGNRGICELLLARGANVGAVDKHGSTALHEAAYFGHTSVVKLLMANGADPNARTKSMTDLAWSTESNKTPLDHAREAGFADTVVALGGDPNAPGLGETGPHGVIITEAQGLRQFLWFEGMDFEDVWIPTPADLKGLDVALGTFLEGNRVIRTRTHFEREYVLAHLRRYDREYGGFVKDGRRCIVCQMHLMGGNMVRSRRKKGFSMICDGGCGVVRIVFDAATKAVIEIDCNGEA
jgi:ankyrin repeat protein